MVPHQNNDDRESRDTENYPPPPEMSKATGRQRASKAATSAAAMHASHCLFVLRRDKPVTTIICGKTNEAEYRTQNVHASNGDAPTKAAKHALSSITTDPTSPMRLASSFGT